MNKRIKLSQWAKLNNYTYQGAFHLFKHGGIENAIQLSTGTILVEVPEESKSNQRKSKTVIYARVSSSENKSNLASQADRIAQFCSANGWIVHQVVKECASGLNDKRPKLQKILSDPSITRIVVEHKDRLTRFGFEYIKTLFDGEIIVINEVKEDEQDLMQDFVSLVTSFCARIYGHRRTKRKTEQLIKQLESDETG